MEQPRRNIRPQQDLLSQHAVGFCALDQGAKALIGQARAAILGHAMHDLAVAAAQQHVGHGLRDPGPSANGEQMRLTLALCNVGEIGVGQSIHPLEQGARDRDIVVVREASHRFDRRLANGREPAREFGACRGLDLADQSAEHQIEQPDVIVVEAARPIEKKGGHPFEGRGPSSG